MNPYRGKDNRLRYGHYDEIDEDNIIDIIETLQSVSRQTGATMNQTIEVYKAATRNRLIEVLLDHGDEMDNYYSTVKEILNDVTNYSGSSSRYLKTAVGGAYNTDPIDMTVRTKEDRPLEVKNK